MEIDFSKMNGLVPAIIQDYKTQVVLMLGFMNEESLKQTQSSGHVTFYSRSKKRLWTKGETSGNFLEVVEIIPHCDQDTLLIKAKPKGPACHTGSDTCFNEANNSNTQFLEYLETVISDRKQKVRIGNLFDKKVAPVALVMVFLAFPFAGIMSFISLYSAETRSGFQ